jgi:hypothetical protein
MFLGLVHAALKRAYADYDAPLEFAQPEANPAASVGTSDP